MKTILGIITARGGSKGIPGKNIKLLLGKPLIAYTIEAAQKAGVFDRLIVSTDDEKIASVAKAHACEVPFLRPAELAQDHTPHEPVLKHAVEWLREHEGYESDYVMILQPTAPARRPFHIRGSVELMKKYDTDSVVSVGEIPAHFHPQKSMYCVDDGTLRLLGGKPIYERISQRQELPTHYWSAGAIYLFKTQLLFHPERPNFYGERVLPYVMENKYLVDINTPEDWEAAEKAMRKLTDQI
ncbi:MAG: N-acylneuraminate cytidylyltransferase [Parcubacteria group bacterium Gr01-1014_66]|nr:MAG: N-acylneuraminate cytidylyltransferase [Parcubacteria group bacterium Gr01-1014_66]